MNAGAIGINCSLCSFRKEGAGKYDSILNPILLCTTVAEAGRRARMRASNAARGGTQGDWSNKKSGWYSEWWVVQILELIPLQSSQQERKEKKPAASRGGA